MNPKKRLDELTDMLNRYAKKYYTEDISEVSDYEYDMLSRELQALEAEYPDLRRADSPSLRVGGSIAEGFEPVVHEVPTPFQKKNSSILTAESKKNFRMPVMTSN